MDHDLPLITTIAAALGLALVFGFLAARMRMPALVGYLFAGIVIGPFTPGFVADTHLASQLAEIGVMLLMFGVGLHFSLGDLLAVRKIAVPGAVVQMAAATAMGMGAATLWGWSLPAALVFGISLSVASTVVLLRALEDRGALDTFNGRIAVGWLVVEDLAMVLVLVLLPPLAGVLAPSGAVPPSDGASAGSRTRTSTIARSSTTSQPTAMRPLWLSSAPRDSSARSSTTVLATDRHTPNTSAPAVDQPQDRPSIAPIAVATTICTTAPGTAMRRTSSRSSSEKCKPTPNISSITPISASCAASCASATKPGVYGPTRSPANR